MTDRTVFVDDIGASQNGNDSPRATSTSAPAPQLSWLQAFAILVSIQIGSGIFSSPSAVDTNAPSPAAALGIWVLSGLVSWAGAASYAELGASLRRAGGTLEYVRYVYGDATACTLAWIWIVAVKPSAMAIQAVVVGDSVALALGRKEGELLSDWTRKAIGMVSMNVIVLLNLRGTSTSAWLGSGFTFLKLTAASVISVGGIVTVMGYVAGHRDPKNTDWYTRSWTEPRVTISPGKNPLDWHHVRWWQHIQHFSIAVYAGLWAYSGWDNASFIARDIKDPTRQLPKSINVAMAVVMLAQLLVNVSYYILLPWDTIGLSTAVAVAAAKSNLGSAAGLIMALLVSISCLGTISGTLFSVGRLTTAASDEHLFPPVFGHLGIPRLRRKRETECSTGESETSPLLQASDPGGAESPSSKLIESERPWHTPMMAMLLQGILTCIYIVIGSFGWLLTFVGMSVWAFLFLTVLGLVILRYREPDITRPYKVFLITPVIFLVVSGIVVVASILFNPFMAIFFILLGLLGAVVRSRL